MMLDQQFRIQNIHSSKSSRFCCRFAQKALHREHGHWAEVDFSMRPIIPISKFKDCVLRCFQHQVPGRVMLALSGGVDSMCLAYLMSEYKRQFNPEMIISAVTIDHGYRHGSAEEADKVGDIVLRWGIEHRVRKLSYTKNVHSITNFEEVARNLRYEVLREECAKSGTRALLVAHNRDDQFETFLQRLQMNSTLYGLLGLRERSALPVSHASPNELDRILVYRPLLTFEKSQIRSTCEKLSVSWFEDLSNQDISITKRNLFRWIINDYVPRMVESRPNLKCLTRDCLDTTTREIETIVADLDFRKLELDSVIKSQHFQFDQVSALIEFSISIYQLRNVREEVLARWIYEEIFPLSSSKHFHWSYAKIERQAVPRIRLWSESPHEALIMTYLNVKFDVRLVSRAVKFRLSRQYPQRDTIQKYSLTVEPSENSWILFDRIWWLKIENSSQRLSVRYYTREMENELMNSFPKLESDNKALLKSLSNFPIVLNIADGRILAVPTLGLARNGLSVACKLKRAFR